MIIQLDSKTSHLRETRRYDPESIPHTVSDKTEAVYLRGDLFDKRRELMGTWAAFATTSNAAKIVTLRKSIV